MAVLLVAFDSRYLIVPDLLWVQTGRLPQQLHNLLVNRGLHEIVHRGVGYLSPLNLEEDAVHPMVRHSMQVRSVGLPLEDVEGFVLKQQPMLLLVFGELYDGGPNRVDYHLGVVSRAVHVAHYPHACRVVVNQEVIRLVQVVLERTEKILSVLREVIPCVYLLDPSSCVRQLVELDATRDNCIADVGKAFKDSVLNPGYGGDQFECGQGITLVDVTRVIVWHQRLRSCIKLLGLSATS